MNQTEEQFLSQYFSTQGYMLGRPQNLCFSPEGRWLYFLRTSTIGNNLCLYQWDVTTKQTTEILRPEHLLENQKEELSPEEKERRERLRMTTQGFTSFEVSPDGSFLLIPFSGRVFLWDCNQKQVTEVAKGKGPVFDAKLSPDGQSIAYVREKNLYVFDIKTKQERKRTYSTDPLISYGLPDFIAQEEMHRYSGFFWSADSQSLAVCEVNNHGVETFFIADPASPEKIPLSFAYPRPGKQNAHVRLGIVSAKEGPITFIKWDDHLFPYLATIRFQDLVTFVVQDRRQKQLQLLQANPETGETQVLLTESDAAWVQLFQESPYLFKNKKYFLWVHESNGGPELSLYNTDGKKEKMLLPKEYGYRRLLSVHEEEMVAFVAASPKPTEQHLYKISIETGIITPITKEPGIHHGIFGNNFWVHIVSTLTSMPRFYVYDFKNHILGELPHIAKEPPFVPQVEITQVGALQFQVAITRPFHFKKDQIYPVFVDVYGGPMHTDVFCNMRRYLLHQWIANQGFIVVCIDGRGTPGRGRDWERIILGDFSKIPLGDQVTALQELFEIYPELDQNKIAINGWSFGGYLAALAVLQRPDIFQVGVAGAPVVDWRDYDTHYTERYLGLPEENPIGYQNSSLLSHAKKLEKPLLILHGTADDNVYFFHGLKLSQELFLHGKEHTFLPLAGITHMIGDPIANQKKWETILSFIQKALCMNR